jgi:uncharacterized protein (TIGR03089 family)
MQLGLSRTPPSGGDDVAQALVAAAASLGQRPAITFLTPAGRQEQGFRSLAGWVAKGAHLLHDELGLRPGDALGVAGPAGWPLASVCLAAWWSGLRITTTNGAPDVAAFVLHVSQPTLTAGLPVLWLGDETDGTAITPDGGECFTEAVLPYPDRAPSPAAAPDAIAWQHGSDRRTQAQLLEQLRTIPAGVVGLRRSRHADVVSDPVALALLALRPLVTGSASVIVDDVTGGDVEELEQAAAAERVAAWP